jgi:hypothetical protein
MWVCVFKLCSASNFCAGFSAVHRKMRGAAFLEIKCVLWAMAIRGVQLRGAEVALERS